MKIAKPWHTLLMAAAWTSSFCFSSAAVATISMPDGWYITGNAGTPKVVEKSATGGSKLRGVGLGASVGYKFMPYLGTEIGYTWFGQSTLKNNVGVAAYTEKHHSYRLALKGMLPVDTSGFEFFAKLGYQELRENLKVENGAAAATLGASVGSKRSHGLFMAAGGEYYFTESLAGLLEWQRAKGGSASGTFDLYSLGLNYIFNY